MRTAFWCILYFACLAFARAFPDYGLTDIMKLIANLFCFCALPLCLVQDVAEILEPWLLRTRK